MFLTLPPFSDPDISYGFFGRLGGVSTGVYDSLNAGLGSDDDPAQVAENIARITQALGGTPETLARVYQIHSATCVTVTQPCIGEGRPRADAMVTDVPGLTLGILTADCAPILFMGQKQNGARVIGAAHAGWRGALAGVAENTVRAMTDLGAELFSIHAAIGPCIAKSSFEVSLGFEQAFLIRDPGDEMFFSEKTDTVTPAQAGVSTSRDSGFRRNDSKLHFDLPGYLARRLNTCGVRRVVLSDVDTYTNAETYFSYRRSCHESSPDCGRQMSAIRVRA